MMKPKFIFLAIILFVQPAAAQLDTSNFLQKVKSLYYTVESTGLLNFSMWVTSDYFRANTDSTVSAQEYPLEIIWMRPNRISFIKRPLVFPEKTDSTKILQAQQLQLDMFRELKGLIFDWQRFYGGGILADLPLDYNLTVQQDTVFVKYETSEQGQKLQVCIYFGLNALCFKVRLTSPDSGQDILIYPLFDYPGQKWLCAGWQVQIIEKEEIQSGFNVEIISDKIDKYWFPRVITMRLQTKQIGVQTYTRKYSIGNVMVNRPIKALD